jgi:hypothetical protein
MGLVLVLCGRNFYVDVDSVVDTKYGKIGRQSIAEHSENSFGLLAGGKFMDKSVVP